MDLSEFLLARIAEDEKLARGCIDAEEWHGVDAWGEETVNFVLTPQGPCDPARVLAECDAKRRIVEMVVAADDPVGTFDPDYWVGLGVAEAALQLLALPYADHPDYREEWRP